MLRFHLVTDTHYWNLEELGYSDHRDQKTLNESGAIIDVAFAHIAAQQDTDILLIAGDLTNNGERASHSGFIQKLRSLQAKGKRIFVITATHDYGLTEINEEGNSDSREGATYRNELRGLYNEFGFAQAIAEYDELSYVAQLAPGYRLLALNDDGNGRSFCGYDEKQMAWILEQIASAKKEGQFLFAMTHHPVLPPSPVYPLMSRRDMLGDYENTSAILADAGLRFIFTGHAHMQNIAQKNTQKGNRLYDINTGSLVGFDAPIRKVTIDEQNMTVQTEHIQDIDWDLQGKTLSQYLMDHFDALLRRIFHCAAHDIDGFADLANGFSVDRETVYKFKVPIQAAGKTLEKLTLRSLSILLFCPQLIPREVRGIKVEDLFVELVRNIYAGDEPYSRDTAIGKAVLALADNAGTFARPFLEKANIRSLRQFIAPIIYDDTPDNNAVLPLR